MLSRERPTAPARTILRPISTTLSRRAALFGAVSVAGIAAAAAVPVVDHAAVLPRLARPAPDAALILLAGRVEVLAGRLWRLDGRLSALEDRLFTARRSRPPLPPEPPSDIVSERRDTATEWVMVMRQPLVADPAHEEWRRARDHAEAAQERDAAALAERYGLPALNRRADRMRRRLHRWVGQLAGTEVATAAGLAAKARALMATGGGEISHLEEAMQAHPGLAASILAAVSTETWGRA